MMQTSRATVAACPDPIPEGSGRHLSTVIYTRRVRDLLRKRYWVVCWRCDVLRLGPFAHRGLAHIVQVDIDSIGPDGAS